MEYSALPHGMLTGDVRVMVYPVANSTSANSVTTSQVTMGGFRDRPSLTLGKFPFKMDDVVLKEARSIVLFHCEVEASQLPRERRTCTMYHYVL